MKPLVQHFSCCYMFLCIISTPIFSNNSETSGVLRNIFLRSEIVKQHTDTAKYKQEKLHALDNILSKTKNDDIIVFTNHLEEYIDLSLELEEYELAVKAIATYFFEVNERGDNLKKAEEIVNRVEKHIHKVSDTELISQFYLEKGVLTFYLQKPNSAIAIFSKVSATKGLKDSTFIADAIFNRGRVYYSKGLYKEALDDYFFSQKFYARRKNMNRTLLIQEAIVIVYGMLGFVEKEIIEREKYMDRKIELGLTDGLYNDYYNMSVSYSDLKDVVNWEKCLLKAKQLAEDENRKNEEAIHVGFLDASLAVFYAKQGDVTNARKYLYMLKEDYKGAPKNSYGDLTTLFVESFYFLSSGQLRKAEKKALLYYNALQKKGEACPIADILEVLDLLYRIYKEKDTKKALKYFESYSKIKDSIFDKDKTNVLSYYQALYETEKKEKDLAAKETIINIQNRQRSYFIVGIVVLSVFVTGLFFFMRKILSQRNIIKKEQEKVNKSLQEKELLLKEIHHRVKNNMQIISALVHKQTKLSDNEEYKKVMNDTDIRIKSMAIVHENLYENNNFSEVNMRDYITELAKNIDATYNEGNNQIDLDINMVITKFNIDVAIPLGLIFNELLTNCYKYAFKRDKGTISIILDHLKEQFYQIRIKDNGIGLPNDFEEKTKHSLGMNLIRGLCKQINASFTYDSNNGSNFYITFENS